MPGVIESAVLLGLTAAGVSGTALTVGTTLLTYGIIGAVGVGLQLLASSLIPKPPQAKPEDLQSSIKQPAQPRSRHYGRVKVSGPWVFAEAKGDYFYKLLAIGEGRIEEFEEYWIEDKKVTVDTSTGEVIAGADAWEGRVNLQTRVGTPNSASYSTLNSAFSGKWTTAHRGRGIASILVRMKRASLEKMFDVYPNHINTNVRVVIKGARVHNPLSGVTEWNANAAAVIRDYMTHADGMRLPLRLFQTSQAIQGWQDAYRTCANAISLKAGGTEWRYRIWGSYQLNERPADVLGRFMAACDGRIYPTSDGGLKLVPGKYQEPTVVIDESCITGFSDFSRGRSILDTANTITATFLGVDQDYQTSDAEPWVDAEDVSNRGEITKDLNLAPVPSHSQARRLMKIEAYRSNPDWVGGLDLNLKGMAVMGERFIRIRYPLFNIDTVFEIDKFQLIIGEDSILQGVSIVVHSMPSFAFDWNASQEEGDAPIYDETEEDNIIEPPTGFTVVIRRKTVSGTIIPFAVLQFDSVVDNGLIIDARGKATAHTQWIRIPVDSEATEAESFALEDGTEYEFEIRAMSASGRASEWVDTAPITPVADTSAPGVPTSRTASGGVGQATLNWVAPNSANYHGTRIYRNTVNNSGTATLVSTEYGAPSSADSYVNTGLAASTYFYWLASINASGVESTRSATTPTSVVVT